MKDLQIYEVRPDGENYRHLVSESGWQFQTHFMLGTNIPDLPIPMLRCLSLEEDVADEQELLENEDGGDPGRAQLRFSRGVGDCAYVRGLSTARVFSRIAREKLATILESTGQVFPVNVEGDDLFIFNCTKLMDAVNSQSSEIEYLSNGRPSKFFRLVFQDSILQQETLFKTKWPKPEKSPSSVDYSKIPPPLTMFATQHFVDVVLECELTGFRFKPVDQNVN